MKIGQGLFAKALRLFFDHFVLTKIGYAIDPFPVGCDEERFIPTACGPMRALFHWPSERREKLPLFVHIHGGGFLFGKPDHDAVFCQRIAQKVGCLVVNLDYWRTPEHPFPTAYHQCYEALVWLADKSAELGIDSTRIAVGGHSAGGNLAAGVVAQTLENDGPKLCLQILDYPFTDACTDPHAKRARIAKPLINPGLASLFNSLYVPDLAQARSPRVSPLFASLDSLRGQPPALVITAGNDLLHDEGDAYAARLREAGVTVRHEVFADVDHYFTHTGPKEPADAAWALMEESLNEAFGGESRV